MGVGSGEVLRHRVRRGLITLALIATAALAGILVPDFRHRLLEAVPPHWKIRAMALMRGVQVDHSLRLRMPDGVELAASLYRPREFTDRLATVLILLPYGRQDYAEAYYNALFFASEGYAVLVQDLRGTGNSGGEQLPWRDAANDGAVTLDWIARQDWSNGKVGTFGCSALGETQLVLGARQHPAHRALVASGAGGAIGSMGGRYGYFGLFEGGIFQLASGFGWLVVHGSRDPHAPKADKFDTASKLRELPVAGLVGSVSSSPNAYQDFLRTPIGDPRWDQWGYLTDQSRLDAPALLINDWFDQTVGDTLYMAEYWRRTQALASQTQRVVIAPGSHCEFEEFPAPHGESWRQWYLKWFDRWLRGRGEGLADVAPYSFYMLGEERWLESESWPPRDSSPMSWYLSSGGHANTSAGDGVLARMPPTERSEDSFVYEPAAPVPTRGGAICCTGDAWDHDGVADQAEVESRDDVLVYTSVPLEHDLRIAGPISARLTISSDAPDTDLVARLVDVAPGGVALNIQEGALRLRLRDGLPERLMKMGEKYQVTVDMRSIAYRVPRGHRLRLDITSSSFPRLARNLNVASDSNHGEITRQARNVLHHGGAVPAQLDLHVLAN